MTVDEVLHFTNHCEDCAGLLRRRWDDQLARPTKFTQRLAVVLAIVIIAVCLVALGKLGGGRI